MGKQRKYVRLDRTGPSSLEVIHGDFRGWCDMMTNISTLEQRYLLNDEYSHTKRRRLMTRGVRRQWFLYQHKARDRARKEFENRIAALRLLRRRE